MLKYIFILIEIFIIAQQVQYINSSKILGIVCAPGPSNNIIHNSVLHALARKGHEVGKNFQFY